MEEEPSLPWKPKKSAEWYQTVSSPQKDARDVQSLQKSQKYQKYQKGEKKQALNHDRREDGDNNPLTTSE